MTNKGKVFQPNAEQKEFLDVLMTTYAVIIGDTMDIDPYEIKMDDLATIVFDNEVELYGYALIQMHLYFELEREYEPYEEFDLFPTLGDAFNYFATRIMVRDGLILESEVYGED